MKEQDQEIILEINKDLIQIKNNLENICNCIKSNTLTKSTKRLTDIITSISDEIIKER